eukprot:gene7095-9680_t
MNFNKYTSDQQPQQQMHQQVENNNMANINNKAASKPIITKRRALGDITNAYNEDDGKEVATKKPLTGKSVSMFVDEKEDAQSVAAPTENIVPATTNNVYMQRPCDDIDIRDKENPLLVTCYVNEMYDHFNDLEREFAVNPLYMQRQDFINEKMRAILVDWLVEVHLKFKMVPESLYMTVNIIDRYLQLKSVRRSKLQLVGVAALLIAAKYEEIYPPELRDLVYITDRAYNKVEILEMESEIVNTLEYKFTVPTIHSFLCRHLKAAHADRTMVQLSCFLTERILQEYSMLKFSPSMIAASAVFIARTSLRRNPWSPTLSRYTKYNDEDLLECIKEIKSVIVDHPNKSQEAVFKKYSSGKFGAVATMQLQFN